MIDALSFLVTITCVGTAARFGVRAVCGRYRWAGATTALAVVQALLVGQAVLDALALVRGHRPAELATHLAYVGVSLVVLPIAVSQAVQDDGRWAAAVVVVALVVCAVVVVRMQTTWRAG